jgi:two-component system chemotaxis response regulator CheY
MEKSPFSSLRVLVADPSIHMATLVGSMFRSLGVRTITEFADGPAALAELKRVAYDVIVVDDAPPGFDGVDFVHQVRRGEGHANRHTSVIMIAAAPSAHRIAQARDAGINEFLRKPFAAEHIRIRLNTILNVQRPFIDGEDYAGPDRRRRTAAVPDERRSGSKD